jgi:hypothetical protein
MMKLANKSHSRACARCHNANLLSAKASPQLVRRVKQAAKLSSLNVSSLVRHGVIRLCEEIERDGFLTIRVQESAASYSMTESAEVPASEPQSPRRGSRKSEKREARP